MIGSSTAILKGWKSLRLPAPLTLCAGRLPVGTQHNRPATRLVTTGREALEFLTFISLHLPPANPLPRYGPWEEGRLRGLLVVAHTVVTSGYYNTRVPAAKTLPAANVLPLAMVVAPTTVVA